MTNKRKALLLLVALGVLLFAGLSGGFWSIILLVGAVGLFAILYRKPSLAQAIVARCWFIAGAGAALIALSFGLIFVNLPPLSITGRPINLVDVVVGGHTVGIMLIVLPFTVRSMGRNRVRSSLRKSPASLRPRSFDGIHQSMQALKYVVKQPKQFLRLAGPWLVAQVAMSLLLIKVAADTPKVHQPGYVSVLTFLLIGFTATLLSLTLYAVLWHRLVLRSEIPVLKWWPSGQVWWSFAWRCWVFSYVINLTDKQWITWGLAQTSAFHLDVGVMKVMLTGSFAVLAFFIASTYALTLPRVAAGQEPQLGFATVAARRLGWRFTVGFAIAASPYLISLLIPAGRGAQAMLSPLGLVSMFVGFILSLFGIASAATYLSWAYLAVEGMRKSAHPVIFDNSTTSEADIA